MKDEMMENRFFELSDKCYRKWLDTSTNFLNLNEQSIFLKLIKKFPTDYIFTGGIENSERKIVIFTRIPEYVKISDFISYIKVSPKDYKFGEVLSHRNYMGAVLNLGINYDTIGDIITDGKVAYIVALKKISDYIVENLKMVNKTVVNAEIVDSLPPHIKIKLKEYMISSNSDRADIIISKIYSISRKGTNEIFIKKDVYVNDKLCLNNSYKLKNGDIVSVRGYGRFIFVEEVSQTKSGNFMYMIKKYVS